MKATLSAKEREELFEKRAKATVSELFGATVSFIIGTGLAWVAIKAAADDNLPGAAVCLFFGSVIAVSGLCFFLASISAAKVRAVKQCLVVAEKFGIALTMWQVRGMESNFNSGAVFTSFEEEIERQRPNLVPEGTFIATGGKKTPEACRYLIEHLWRSDNPQVWWKKCRIVPKPVPKHLLGLDWFSKCRRGP